MAMRTLNDTDFGAPSTDGGGARASFLERLFDEHSDGRFVKYLLIVIRPDLAAAGARRAGAVEDAACGTGEAGMSSTAASTALC